MLCHHLSVSDLACLQPVIRRRRHSIEVAVASALFSPQQDAKRRGGRSSGRPVSVLYHDLTNNTMDHQR